MTTTSQTAEWVTTRLVAAAPMNRPEDFVRTVESITGRAIVVDEMKGFVGRNNNWLVPTVDGPDFFVKCLSGDPAQTANRLKRILAFENVVAAHPPREYRTAPFRGSDPEQALLVFDCLPRSQTASELFADDELDVELVHRLGRVLGEIHRLPPLPIDVDDGLEAKAATSFYALSADGYANCSGGEVEAWAMLQHDKVLVDALGRLQTMSETAPTVATHCDIRLDQFLLANDQIYVIDWEEFRYSDPARDIGGFVGEFIHHAAMRMFAELDVEPGLSPGEAHEAIMASGEEQMVKVGDYVRQFWVGYRSVADVDDQLVIRATAYAGWHFFDRLLAGAAHGARLSAAERGMAGIGRNALIEPERYASTIGLDLGLTS
jgi:Phosphotransferase enzyme family